MGHPVAPPIPSLVTYRQGWKATLENVVKVDFLVSKVQSNPQGQTLLVSLSEGQSIRAQGREGHGFRSPTGLT